MAEEDEQPRMPRRRKNGVQSVVEGYVSNDCGITRRHRCGTFRRLPLLSPNEYLRRPKQLHI
jgi:hypothetical protein